MRTLLILLVALAFTVSAQADTWCKWDGTAGVSCQSDSRGFIRLDNGLPVGGDDDNKISRGWYKLVTIQLTLGENQVRDQEQWSFADNQITRTWTVRDLTEQEINERVASPMSQSEYLLWKAIQLTGSYTNKQMANFMGAELVEAWLARKALNGD